MQAMEPDFASVLAVYSDDCRPFRVQAAVNSGFSGSRLWKLETKQGLLCLRRWPTEYPDLAQLRWIHGNLADIYAAGFPSIPLPVLTSQRQTVVEHQDHLWELTPWLPGEADQQNTQNTSSPLRITAATAALAKFHLAASQVQKIQNQGNAPGLIHRTELLKKLIQGGIDQLQRQINLQHQAWPELAERSTTLLDFFSQIAVVVNEKLHHALNTRVPIQPCIRDIHRDHVLFVGDSVSGIIDFGSMKLDSVACDIARLLGSMAFDEAPLWENGLKAYEQIRPLTDVERRFVSIYDQTTVLLSGVNWLQWVFVEHRQFASRQAVLERFNSILRRLARLARDIAPIGDSGTN